MSRRAAAPGSRRSTRSTIPETGKLLAWNNVGADGLINPATSHHGMKVRKGRKYVITKWYRERDGVWGL